MTCDQRPVTCKRNLPKFKAASRNNPGMKTQVCFSRIDKMLVKGYCNNWLETEATKGNNQRQDQFERNIKMKQFSLQTRATIQSRFCRLHGLIDKSEQRLQHATFEAEEKGRKVGLTINLKKTKERNDITTSLSNQNSLQNVDKFVYLGSTLSYNGNLTAELDNGIGKIVNAFHRHLPAMCHQDAHKNCYLPSSSTTDFTVWVRKLEHHHPRRETQMPKKNSWQDHVLNEVIFERTSQALLNNIIQHKLLSWLKHVVRMHETCLLSWLLYREP